MRAFLCPSSQSRISVQNAYYASVRIYNAFNGKPIKAPMRGWLGRAMVLGSFQCRGVLLLWHMVGHGPAVPAAGAGRGWFFFFVFFVFCCCCFISSVLSSFSNASSLGRRLDILQYCGIGRYNPAVVVSCYQRCSR